MSSTSWQYSSTLWSSLRLAFVPDMEKAASVKRLDKKTLQMGFTGSESLLSKRSWRISIIQRRAARFILRSSAFRLASGYATTPVV
eukprot:scaffold1528_cov198-Pinguiococcus_pyrenoidosus.AAC.20